MAEALTTDQVFIRKLIDIIVANLGNENFGGDELADEVGMSRSRLNKRLNAIINKKTNQFIREVRLQKALEMLRNDSVTVSEIAFKVGFTSPNYFNTCFHEFFGYPPGKVRKERRESLDDNLNLYVNSLEKGKRISRQILTANKNWIIGVSIFIVIVAVLIVPKFFRRSTIDDLRSKDGRISIAVMPFQNLTNDTKWNIWQFGIQDELTTTLTNSEELDVKQIESINSLIQNRDLTNYSSITFSTGISISAKLGANIFIYGNIKEEESRIRLNAQIINANTGETLKPFQVNGSEWEILQAIDSLSVMVKNYLIISKLRKELPLDPRKFLSTSSPEAFRWFMYGENEYNKRNYQLAVTNYLKAVAIDSNFASAILKLSLASRYAGFYDQAKDFCLRLYRKKDELPDQQRIYANLLYSVCFETPYESIRYLKELRDIDNQVPHTYYQIGFAYFMLHQYDQAIPQFENALKIYDKWDTKPLWINNYRLPGIAYHKTNQYKKEKKLYRKAEKDFPDNPDLIYLQAIQSLSEGDTVLAKKYISEYITIRREDSWPEVIIIRSLASIYAEAGILDRAEEYYRKALSLEPENPGSLKDLACFLIERDQDIKGGLDLIDKALEISPENIWYLDCKGWGLYKQGKYEEALKYIEKAWDLKPMYFHELFLHLEAAKKAANQKKN